jgi:hypothetical protein
MATKHYLSCDECRKVSTFPKDAKKGLERVAREAGWRPTGLRNPKGRNLCPECLERARQKREARNAPKKRIPKPFSFPCGACEADFKCEALGQTGAAKAARAAGWIVGVTKGRSNKCPRCGRKKEQATIRDTFIKLPPRIRLLILVTCSPVDPTRAWLSDVLERLGQETANNALGGFLMTSVFGTEGKGKHARVFATIDGLALLQETFGVDYRTRALAFYQEALSQAKVRPLAPEHPGTIAA